MKYTITGGAGNISKPLVKTLLAEGHIVTVIGRNEVHLESLTKLGAKAAIGSVEDVAFLTEAFTGADAVYTMVPPKWDAPVWKDYIGHIGQNFTAAITAAGVKKVVNLSSIGAHMPEGCGPVSGLYKAEQALNELTGVDIRHLRPAYFFHNLLANIGMIKGAGIIGGNFGGSDDKLVMVHPADIAEAAAEELLKLDFAGHTIRYIASDEITGAELAQAIGAAIGNPALPWVEFSDDQNLEGMLQAGLPKDIASNYSEMGNAIRTGKMSEDYWKNHPILSKHKLADFVKEFAAAYAA
ncbi:MAG: NAD(P)H-binding protein [Chitinophagaceae bacterium]